MRLDEKLGGMGSGTPMPVFSQNRTADTAVAHDILKLIGVRRVDSAVSSPPNPPPRLASPPPAPASNSAPAQSGSPHWALYTPQSPTAAATTWPDDSES